MKSKKKKFPLFSLSTIIFVNLLIHFANSQSHTYFDNLHHRGQHSRHSSSSSIRHPSSAASNRSEDLWFLEQQIPWPRQPYSFGYEVRDPYGNQQYRSETSDSAGQVTGSYGYWGPDGVYRHVDYVADHLGYRASVRTSEPGITSDDPSNVRVTAFPSFPGGLPPPASSSFRSPPIPPPPPPQPVSPPPPPRQLPVPPPPTSKTRIPTRASTPSFETPRRVPVYGGFEMYGQRRISDGRPESYSYGYPDGSYITTAVNKRTDYSSTVASVHYDSEEEGPRSNADIYDGYGVKRKGSCCSGEDGRDGRRSKLITPSAYTPSFTGKGTAGKKGSRESKSRTGKTNVPVFSPRDVQRKTVDPPTTASPPERRTQDDGQKRLSRMTLRRPTPVKVSHSSSSRFQHSGDTERIHIHEAAGSNREEEESRGTIDKKEERKDDIPRGDVEKEKLIVDNRYLPIKRDNLEKEYLIRKSYFDLQSLPLFTSSWATTSPSSTTTSTTTPKPSTAPSESAEYFDWAANLRREREGSWKKVDRRLVTPSGHLMGVRLTSIKPLSSSGTTPSFRSGLLEVPAPIEENKATTPQTPVSWPHREEYRIQSLPIDVSAEVIRLPPVVSNSDGSSSVSAKLATLVFDENSLRPTTALASSSSEEEKVPVVRIDERINRIEHPNVIEVPNRSGSKEQKLYDESWKEFGKKIVSNSSAVTRPAISYHFSRSVISLMPRRMESDEVITTPISLMRDAEEKLASSEVTTTEEPSTTTLSEISNDSIVTTIDYSNRDEITTTDNPFVFDIPDDPLDERRKEKDRESLEAAIEAENDDNPTEDKVVDEDEVLWKK